MVRAYPSTSFYLFYFYFTSISYSPLITIVVFHPILSSIVDVGQIYYLYSKLLALIYYILLVFFLVPYSISPDCSLPDYISIHHLLSISSRLLLIALLGRPLSHILLLPHTCNIMLILSSCIILFMVRVCLSIGLYLFYFYFTSIMSYPLLSIVVVSHFHSEQYSRCRLGLLLL